MKDNLQIATQYKYDSISGRYVTTEHVDLFLETLTSKFKITTAGYSVQNKNWDSNGGYVHLFENGVADYFDKNGFWMFSSNESDSYLVINGVTYSPQSNDLPRQS